MPFPAGTGIRHQDRPAACVTRNAVKLMRRYTRAVPTPVIFLRPSNWFGWYSSRTFSESWVCASADRQPPSSTTSAAVTDHHGEEVDALVLGPTVSSFAASSQWSHARAVDLAISMAAASSSVSSFSRFSTACRLPTRPPLILGGITETMMIPPQFCLPRCSDVKRGLVQEL
jgi:hypothetical protein